MSDTDYHGDAMDLALANGGVFNFRRHDELIKMAVTPGPVGVLTADEAEDVARNLLAAAKLARES